MTALGRSFEGVITLATVVLLAWGTFAFGAVYEWAYLPLVAASLGIGATSLLVAGRRGGPTRDLAIALAVTALAVAVQLIPLPAATIASFSPATDRVLREYDVAYALAERDGSSHPLSIDPGSTRRGLAFLACFAVLLVGLGRVLTRRQALHLAAWLTALGAIIALVGIVFQAKYTGKVYGFWKPEVGIAPFGPFVNRNHFAGWMLMAIPLAGGRFCGLMASRTHDVGATWRKRMLWFSSADATQVLLAAFALLTMALSLVLTKSRSGISALAAAFVLAAWVVLRRQPAGSRRLIALAYLVFVAVATILWAGVDSVVTRFGHLGAGDLSGRLPIWADGVRIVRDFPLTGTGLNTFGIATLFYQTAIPDAHLNEAHNDYLQLVAEGGLLVGLPIAAAIAIFIREVFRRFREAGDGVMSYWIRVGAVTGLVAIALQSVGEFSLQMPGNAALFTVLCAIAIRARDPGRSAA